MASGLPIAVVRRRLLAWFRRHARPLPWRDNRDPYRIWISEIMLQQTQVATVIPYFHRFLDRFPTLTDLAQADEQDVLRLWEGLGYYRRARALWQAARYLGENNYTTIPDDPDRVAALPGFGRYTVGAVLSQAYDRRLPILEANSQRILCRLFGIDDDPRDAAVQKQLWQLAEAMLPPKSVGDFNQALMELGQMVCTSAKPGCSHCPLASQCLANRQERQDQIPRRAKPAATVAVEEVAAVIFRRGRILLVQRPEEGRWPGLWEVPHLSVEGMESHDAAADRLLKTLSITGSVQHVIATIRHSVTRFRITMTCVRVAHRRGVVRSKVYPNIRWVRTEEVQEYPLSTPQRRLCRILLENRQIP